MSITDPPLVCDGDQLWRRHRWRHSRRRCHNTDDTSLSPVRHLGDRRAPEEPMNAVMQGVRILEVAEHTFVPAASALMADWGADVIKIEHVERGDAMRGLASSGVMDLPSNVHVLLEHSNRGKRSLALDLTSPEGLDILYKLAATSDIFLTNKLPERPHEAEDRRRRHPRAQPAHHLRARHRARRAGPGSRQGLLRLPRVLVARRSRRRFPTARVRRSTGPAGTRLR